MYWGSRPEKTLKESYHFQPELSSVDDILHAFVYFNIPAVGMSINYMDK